MSLATRPIVHEHVLLSPHTTLRMGGLARYYIVCQNAEDIRSAYQFAREKNIPLVPLGGGSNVVIATDLPDICVLKMENNFLDILAEDADTVSIRVGAGYLWDDFVAYAVAHGYAGIEALSYIPGTCGATPVQNVGAYGTEVSSVISSVRAFDTESDSFVDIDASLCGFAYRTSIFKQHSGRYIIESVVFALTKHEPNIPSYPLVGEMVAKIMADNPWVSRLSAVRSAIIEIRKSKLPDPKDIPNVGSFFGNPSITQIQYDELLKKFPQIPSFPAGDMVKYLRAGLLNKWGIRVEIKVV